MHTTQAEFSEAYRKLTDEDIAELYADIDSLTEEARSALLAEARQRGMNEAQLQKMHAVEVTPSSAAFALDDPAGDAFFYDGGHSVSINASPPALADFLAHL